MKKKKALPDDWKREPLPEKHSTVSLDRSFSDKEMAKIELGYIPKQMEQKWFVYWEDSTLYFHRSWTGYCIYIVHFERDETGWHMRSAEVNRDPSQYTETDDHHDAELIGYLVDVLLLRTAADFPAMYGSSSENAIAAWSIAGMDSLGGWGSLSAEQLLGGMFGLAVGDALGVPVEFTSRAERDADPVTGYREYGTHYQPAGTWSDDTSLSLALLDSLCSGIDYRDIARRFLDWSRGDETYTAGGPLFDIGNATSRALSRFAAGTEALQCGGTDEYSNGNGSLMRILPAAIYSYAMQPPHRKEIIFDISSITHGHLRSRLAALLYSEVVKNLIYRENKVQAVDGAHAFVRSILSGREEKEEFEHFARCTSKIFPVLEEDISSSGYVVSTLEASLWCFLRYSGYSRIVLKAVNLGDDSDTTAAVAGSLAGLYYGYSSIPEEWVRGLRRGDYLYSLCKRFFEDFEPSHW